SATPVISTPPLHDALPIFTLKIPDILINILNSTVLSDYLHCPLLSDSGAARHIISTVTPKRKQINNIDRVRYIVMALYFLRAPYFSIPGPSSRLQYFNILFNKLSKILI